MIAQAQVYLSEVADRVARVDELLRALRCPWALQ